MSFTLFSATGCMRCKIVKSYMDDHGMVYEDHDMKAEGKDIFNGFYRKNRPDIFRGEEGIEFPILYTGEKIKQGVGEILAFLKAEDKLIEFIKRSDLSHGWISGLNIFANDVSMGDDFLEILRYIKTHGLLIQLETDGRNSHLLETIITENLVDRLLFQLRGPAELYEVITGFSLEKEELCKSLCLAGKSPGYQIILSISCIPRPHGQPGYITPEEATSAAALVEQATGSKKHPFFIKGVAPPPDLDITPLPVSAFFKYRTACRPYMVLAEILK
ncbi:MAG: hypothetical protein H8D87_15090 [Deltaproteobacteria bacterium]|uniref:hypothetical protein n=1 Tax=Desulfobacula sp. TaxID=2593537 RepID=UPI00199869AA|nr:hypothetical protein [Candidatus Desulfobacula maris]MBL6994331.1 hypothetical protein [Desulfobacula sp.]